MKSIEENFITIQGWMVTELGLSGNELIVFSLVFGFCQDGETEFRGSLRYISTWLNCSKSTAIRVLDGLVKKELLKKHQENVNGVIFNRFMISEMNRGVSKRDRGGGIKMTPGGGIKMTPHIDDSDKDILKKSFVGFDKPTPPPDCTSEDESPLHLEAKKDDTTPHPLRPPTRRERLDPQAVEILVYLNERAKRNFPTAGKRAEGNVRTIAARLADGYSLEELKRIIDSKAGDWAGDVKMSEYLRPSTLFCPKHVGDYLEKAMKETKQARPTATPADPDGLVFDIRLNGQEETFRAWWRRLKEAYPNTAADVRFFTASEFASFTADVPAWFPLFKQYYSEGRRKRILQQALAELETDPHRKRTAEGGLFAFLSTRFQELAE